MSGGFSIFFGSAVANLAVASYFKWRSSRRVIVFERGPDGVFRDSLLRKERLFKIWFWISCAVIAAFGYFALFNL